MKRIPEWVLWIVVALLFLCVHFCSGADGMDRCALGEPVAMVQGPYHEHTFVALFQHLETSQWKRAELRIGERWNGGKLIFFGQDELIRYAFRAAGWTVLQPPYYTRTATLVIHTAHIGGNVTGVKRIVAYLASLLYRGGVLALPLFDEHDLFPHSDITDLQGEALIDYVMQPFTRMGGMSIRGRYYSIWQKNRRRSA